MQKSLTTERLLLRAFALSDAQRVQTLAGDQRAADMTANIPHPYLDGVAEQWIGSHETLFKNNQAVVYAIVFIETDLLVGAVSLNPITEGDANLGYWLGVPYWGKGYATEAARAIVQHGFSELCLTMIHAQHLVTNPASGKVIMKCGFDCISDKKLTVSGKVRHVKHYEQHNR